VKGVALETETRGDDYEKEEKKYQYFYHNDNVDSDDVRMRK